MWCVPFLIRIVVVGQETAYIETVSGKRLQQIGYMLYKTKNKPKWREEKKNTTTNKVEKYVKISFGFFFLFFFRSLHVQIPFKWEKWEK